MGKQDNRKQIAEEITKQLEKDTGLTWTPIIYNGSTSIEYAQYNLYFIFDVYNHDKPSSLTINRNGPVTISIDELYTLLDSINKICSKRHFISLKINENKEIKNFLDVIDIEHESVIDLGVEIYRTIVEKIDSAIKKGTFKIVNLDNVDKKYIEYLRDRDAIVVAMSYGKYALLFDNE